MGEEKEKGAKNMELAAGVETRTEPETSPMGLPHVLRLGG